LAGTNATIVCLFVSNEEEGNNKRFITLTPGLAAERRSYVLQQVSPRLLLVAVDTRLERPRRAGGSRRVTDVGLADVGGPLVLVVVLERLVASAATKAEGSGIDKIATSSQNVNNSVAKA
jgi:hypothetical protein